VPITAGGDHTITLPILRAIAAEGPVGCLHCDARADTLDTLLDTKINHGTPFRRAVEEDSIDPKRMIQIGLRGTRYSDEDIALGYDVGMRLMTMEDYEEMGRAQINTETRRVVGEGPTYIGPVTL
jgi:guanidinopropionase